MNGSADPRGPSSGRLPRESDPSSPVRHSSGASQPSSSTPSGASQAVSTSDLSGSDRDEWQLIHLSEQCLDNSKSGGDYEMIAES